MKKRPGRLYEQNWHFRSLHYKAWNKCHDAHTEWLPDDEELRKIIRSVRLRGEAEWDCETEDYVLFICNEDKLIKAIRKRLT